MLSDKHDIIEKKVNWTLNFINYDSILYNSKSSVTF